MKPIISKEGQRVGIVDIRVPPLSNNEVLYNLPYIKSLIGLGVPYIAGLDKKPLPPPPMLFPNSVKWPIVPELIKYDKLYYSVSRFTPSEVAFALFEFVP
eukprot:Tbor_TRINITY_DN8954_c0_g1::TRINITY_DN8954_c0_g1_i1::g.11924::m.11924